MVSSTSTSTALVIVVTTLLGACVSGSYGLKCYSCSNCEGDNYEAQTCAEGQDTCMKVELSDSVTIRACSKQEACAAGKFLQDGFGSAWDSIKGLFNDDIQKTETSKPMECCTSNYCNNSNSVQNSPLLLLLLPMTIIVLQWMKS